MKVLTLKLLAGLLFVACVAFGAGVAEAPAPKHELIILNEANHVTLRGPVTDDSISKLISDLAALLEKRKDKDPLYIVLDTPGGSVLAGFRLYEFLKPYKNIHTITLNSYSMGAILVEMIQGDRLMIETGTLMFHRMSISMPGGQKVEEIKAKAEYFMQMEHFAQHKVAERVKMDSEELHKEFDAELYMDGSTALKRNFVDKIVAVKCSAKLLKEKKIVSIQPVPFLPPIDVTIPSCPLL